MALFDVNVASVADVPGPEVVVCDTTATPTEWNEFAGRCACSYRCLYHAAPTLYLTTSPLARALRFDIMLIECGRGEKIGQCSVVKGLGTYYVSDQIQLLPQHQSRWSDAMSSLLKRVGPGRYVYGSEWMLDPPREAQLEALEQVRVVDVARSYLEVIDFRAYPDWETYYKSVSRNAVRNCNAFRNEHRHSRVATADGRRILGLLHKTTKLKLSVLKTKSVIRFPLVAYVKTVLRTLCLLPALRSYLCLEKGRLVGFALCVSVGDAAFYLEGGSQKALRGAGWFVLLGAIRDAFVRSRGAGMFVMGPVRPETLEQAHWLGLRRSREQCRVVRRSVSTIRFQYG